MEYNIKSIKEGFKKNGVFYTPPELALLIKSYIKRDVKEVYDPTCGDGALLSVFGDNVKKYGQELNGEQLKVAKERIINFIGKQGDTLSNPAFLEKKFDCIVANPPFSIKWDPPIENGIFTDVRFKNAPILPSRSKADYAFLLHIIYYLSDNGIAVTLNFPGILYRGNREGKIRKWVVEQNYIDQVVLIPPKTFVDTPIATVLVVFKKNKKTTDIIFTDKELNIERVVSKKEVVDNDYNLSVSSFCYNEEEVVYKDPKVLEKNSRKAMISKLRKDIEFSRVICELDGFKFSSYIDELQKIIDEYK